MTDKLLSALKNVLVTINCFYAITGVILLYLGISTQLEQKTFNILWAEYYTAAYSVGVGAVILLVAVFGFVGAIKEIPLINIAFAVAMFLTLVLQLVVGIGGYVDRGYALDDLQAQLPWTLDQHGISTETVEQWNILQQRFECCGVTNATDWLVPLNTQESLQVPSSCCSSSYSYLAGIANCSVPDAYTRGCGDLFINFVTNNMDSLWTAGAFLSLMQGLIVVSVVSSLWMVKVAREADPPFQRL